MTAKSLFFWEVQAKTGEWSLHPIGHETKQEAEAAIPSFHKVFKNKTRVVEYVRKS